MSPQRRVAFRKPSILITNGIAEHIAEAELHLNFEVPRGLTMRARPAIAYDVANAHLLPRRHPDRRLNRPVPQSVRDRPDQSSAEPGRALYPKEAFSSQLPPLTDRIYRE